jgi:cyclophilin family peptidyl-prolyl cis-trans isomerase
MYICFGILLSVIAIGGCADRTCDPCRYPDMAVLRTSMGQITVVLYTHIAKNTVANFVRLADSGFYDGLVFHRVVEDFVVQGGSFDTDGVHHSSPYGYIDLEVHPDARHIDGAVSMVRLASNPNTVSSGFFICVGAQHQLDDGYAVFGVVVDGMEVVQEIASVPVTKKHGADNWPVNDVTLERVTIRTQRE